MKSGIFGRYGVCALIDGAGSSIPAAPVAACRIIFAFRQYMPCTDQEISRWEQNYRELSARHRTLLHHLPAKAAAARVAVQQNQMFFKALLMDFAEEGAADETGAGDGVPNNLSAGALKHADELEASQQRCPPGDAEKVVRLLSILATHLSCLHKHLPPIFDVLQQYNASIQCINTMQQYNAAIQVCQG
jgi:hypothetical protein